MVPKTSAQSTALWETVATCHLQLPLFTYECICQEVSVRAAGGKGNDVHEKRFWFLGGKFHNFLLETSQKGQHSVQEVLSTFLPSIQGCSSAPGISQLRAGLGGGCGARNPHSTTPNPPPGHQGSATFLPGMKPCPPALKSHPGEWHSANV